MRIDESALGISREKHHRYLNGRLEKRSCCALTSKVECDPQLPSAANIYCPARLFFNHLGGPHQEGLRDGEANWARESRWPGTKQNYRLGDIGSDDEQHLVTLERYLD